MIETAEAINSVFEGMLETLNEMETPGKPKSRNSAVSAIRYRKRTFRSTLLRVNSLEKRAMSSTQVYQALVTQADSHAMKFIAVLTLIFLPLTGVSTVFSSPFFNIDFDKELNPLRVAWCFWKFWAVVGPLTVAICVLCYLWFRFPAWKEFWQEARREQRRREQKKEKLGV